MEKLTDDFEKLETKSKMGFNINQKVEVPFVNGLITLTISSFYQKGDDIFIRLIGSGMVININKIKATQK